MVLPKTSQTVRKLLGSSEARKSWITNRGNDVVPALLASRNKKLCCRVFISYFILFSIPIWKKHKILGQKNKGPGIYISEAALLSTQIHQSGFDVDEPDS